MTVRQGLPVQSFSRLLICFFLSGIAGLIYQVAWAKALGLVFGHALYAVATVLAVFMGGLAIGSAYWDRWTRRRPDPVGLYAWLEFLAGLTGLLSLIGLPVVQTLYVSVYPAFSGSAVLLLILSFVGAALIVFLPTFFMGGTFPILFSAMANKTEQGAKRMSQLYWSNTAGAVLGTLLAGFVLLPTLGGHATVATAVALNGFAGFLALSVRNEIPAGVGEQPKSSVVTAPVASASSAPAFLLLVFGVIGCTAFAYEIAWTRLLAITLGSSTYAFTLMLATFLAGLAIGSAFCEFFVSRGGRASATTLAWAQLGIGATTLGSLVAFHWIPTLIPPLLQATNRTFTGLVMTQIVITVFTVLPAAIIFGVNFPLMMDVIRGDRQGQPGPSAPVGLAYAANTIGAIVGSLVTGFWLLPWWGSFHVIAAVAAVNILIAWSLCGTSLRQHRVALGIGAFLLLSTFWVGSSSLFSDPALLSFSAVLYGSSYEGRLTLTEMAATKDLVFRTEGVNGSISVVRTDGDVALRVNGKIDASTLDAPTQLLLGHLGAVFHPAPRRVLVIGFGSGMTVSAVARYPDVQAIDCVEIEPAVLRAAPYLSSLHRQVLRDTRLHLIFDDARNFLLTSRKPYDLIVSEPSNPWIAGIASLFTDEYYAAAQQRLRPEGSFVQWVQAYSLAPSDLRMIVATFARHFPETTLWRAGENDLLLLGRTQTDPLSFGRLRLLWGSKPLSQDFRLLANSPTRGSSRLFPIEQCRCATVRRRQPLKHGRPDAAGVPRAT